MKFIRDGIPFDVNQFQTIEGIQYPVGWFQDPDNRAALDIIEWVDAPVDPVPAADVPTSVSRRQARQALLLRGLLGKVPALLDGIEDEMQRELSKIEWEDATEFVRARPLVVQIGLALGLDEAGLDELFIFAATL